MYTKIKQCPYCNGTADLYFNYSPKCRVFFVYVRCEICGSTGKAFKSQDEPADVEWKNDACESAIRAWNMRNGIPDPGEQ